MKTQLGRARIGQTILHQVLYLWSEMFQRQYCANFEIMSIHMKQQQKKQDHLIGRSFVYIRYPVTS